MADCKDKAGPWGGDGKFPEAAKIKVRIHGDPFYEPDRTFSRALFAA